MKFLNFWKHCCPVLNYCKVRFGSCCFPKYLIIQIFFFRLQNSIGSEISLKFECLLALFPVLLYPPVKISFWWALRTFVWLLFLNICILLRGVSYCSFRRNWDWIHHRDVWRIPNWEDPDLSYVGCNMPGELLGL